MQLFRQKIRKKCFNLFRFVWDYYSKGAHYEDATLSQIALLPVNHIVESVKADYAAMRNMIYGDYPSFEEIIMTLENLEKDIHNLE